MRGFKPRGVVTFSRCIIGIGRRDEQLVEALHRIVGGEARGRRGFFARTYDTLAERLPSRHLRRAEEQGCGASGGERRA